VVTIAIRLAGDADLPSVVRILRDCVTGMRAAGIEQWDDIYPTDRDLSHDIGARSMWVACAADESVTGLVVLNESEAPEYRTVPWTSCRPLVVHRLMVAPRHEGCGIAHALMTFAEQHARTSGYQSIRLDAFTLNPRALRLYQRLGYDARGTVRLRKGLFWCFEKVL
jgi:GNAT superfamily N-acetyltransferase